MSTATTSSNIAHLPHTAHPLPLREQAFTLHCQGLRSPAISAELGVSERTIRAWIAAALADLKDDLQLSRKEQLLLAVERQHQLTASAWQQFDAEAAARSALLDATLNTLITATTAPDASARSITVRLPASTPAPRYLSLIIQANKETNRLLGLHTLAKLHLLTPESLSDDPISLATADVPAESATAATGSPTAAELATGFPMATEDVKVSEAKFPPERVTSGDRERRQDGVPSGADSRIPAITATASASLAPSPAFRPNTPAPVFQGRDSALPAESAIAILREPSFLSC